MSIYKRLLSYTFPYWYAYLVVLVGFGLYAVTQWAWAHLMETLIEVLHARAFEKTTGIALFVVGIFIIRGVGSFLGLYGVAYVSRLVVRDLREAIFKHLMELPLSYYHRQSSGKVTAKIIFNLELVASACSSAVKILVQEGLTVLVLLGYLFYSNWRLTSLFVLAAPLIAWVVWVASRRLRMLSERIQTSMGDVNQITSETLVGYQTVKSLGGEARRIDTFRQASDYNCRQGLKLEVTNALSTPIVQLLVGIQLAFLIVLAFSVAADQQVSAAQFMAYLTAAALMTKPMRQLTQVNTILQRGIAAAESVFRVLDHPQEGNPGTLKPNIRGAVEFKSVCFTYPGDDQPTLKQVSFKIDPGQTFGFVGRTGGGKSTLVNLLLGYFVPDSGQILIDGIDIQAIERAHLRSQVALVSQDLRFFDGSILENLTLGMKKDVNLDQLDRVLALAQVDEFIHSLEKGVSYPLTENAQQLSTGQRQRLAIARALLREAPILVLDEATSALDNELERWVQRALDHELGEVTTLVIAHRLSTIEQADQICVLHEGRIVETGTHTQLLALGGRYAQLHEAQVSAGGDAAGQ